MDEAHPELVGDMGAIRDETLTLDENVAVVRLGKTGKDADEVRTCPAPFAPTSPWTSPGKTDSDAPRSA